MKRIFIWMLALLLLATALPVAAGEAGVKVTLICGETRETHTVEGDFELPTPQTGEKIFLGWLWENGGTPAIYPAGSVITPAKDSELTALAVEMKTIAPELRVLSAGDLGLRFLTEINAADLARLEKICKVGYGTIIAPLHYTSNGRGGSFPLTPQGILENKKTQYLDVRAGAFYRESETCKTIAGSVHAIKGKNSTTKFLGVGYLSFLYADGSEGRVYAPTDRGNFASFYQKLCEFSATAPAGDELNWVNAALAGFAEVEWDISASPYRVLRGGEFFTMTQKKKTADDVVFYLKVKSGISFRFDRNLYALITNGAAIRPDWYQISEDGKTISFEYSLYTSNY